MQTQLVPRLGEFHTVMKFLRVIGKKFGDSGMRDIIIESLCIAAGSMKGVINGHSYNRSIRVKKLLVESMYGLVIEEFVSGLESSSAVESVSLELARQPRSRATVGDNADDAFCERVANIHGSLY